MIKSDSGFAVLGNQDFPSKDLAVAELRSWRIHREWKFSSTTAPMAR